MNTTFKQKGRIISILAIIITNAIPLIGVLFYHWDAKGIIYIYWLETIILCFFNIFKMETAEGKKITVDSSIYGKSIASYDRSQLAGYAFFVYILYIIVYGICVFFIFKINPFNYPYKIVLLIFFIEYAIDYYFNFVKTLDYKQISPADQFGKPMVRLVFIHFLIVSGMFFGGSSIVAIAVLVLLKILYETFIKYRY